MKFQRINECDKSKYMDLLLIADESVSMIEKYLYRGDLFALYENDEVRALCVVTEEQPGSYELKNIVTIPQYQQRGYGHKLITYIFDYYKAVGREMYVGTGDCPTTLSFYEGCGFVRSHIVEHFFIDNYDHPMYEEGKQLVDMVYLKKML